MLYRYHLRVIVWNTAEVPPSETSITGEEMSDLYLKGKRGNFLPKIYLFIFFFLKFLKILHFAGINFRE